MNNNDERDYAEEEANRRLLDGGDDAEEFDEYDRSEKGCTDGRCYCGAEE